MTPQPQHARTFLALHQQGFLMPNAWDAGSAKMLVAEGFPAIGVTSAGVAFSLGKPDYWLEDARAGVTRDEMLRRAGEIAAAVSVPVNGDLEAGYGERPKAVAETVRLAMDAGLAGGNIEDKDPARDALYDEDLAVERIAAARAAAGDDFMVNARTDALLTGQPDALKTAIRRANRFLEAGAHGVFTPGPVDVETVRILAREIAGPVNVVLGLAGASGDAPALIAAGARRISVGGSIARTAMGLIQRCARELRDRGTVSFAVDQIPQAELNRLFEGVG